MQWLLWLVGACYLLSPVVVRLCYWCMDMTDPEERKNMRLALYVMAPCFVLWLVMHAVERFLFGAKHE